MTISIEQGIGWMQAREGQVYYDMGNRNGPNSYDCSSSIYYALRSAGASDNGWAVNTESEHDWLIKNGYVLVAENADWNMVRGDIIIWGVRGQSIGAGGHTMMALDDSNVIHCTWNDGVTTGIMTSNYDQLYAWCRGLMGGPYVYVYRYAGTPNEEPISQIEIRSEFERELDVNTPLSNSDMPYYEATVNTGEGGYYLETQPNLAGPDKEFVADGTRLRVYEKVNGFARVNAPQSEQWIEDKYLEDATEM